MKVSIIIPVFNSEVSIERCLNSVINQTYHNIEILIIDNNSKDNSWNIIKKYDDNDNRIILLKEKRQGVSYARNLGIKNSTGDYVMFVDSDDYLELNAVEVMISLIKKKKCDVIRAFYKTDIKTYDCIPKYKQNYLYNKNEIYNYLIPNIINQKIGSYIWLLLIKRDLLTNIHFNEKLFIHQDLYFYLELLNSINNIYFCSNIIYHYNYSHNSSKSSTYYYRNIYNIIDLYNELLHSSFKKYDINHLCFKMIIPYFGKLYYHDKDLFIKVINDLKKNNTFNDIYNNLKIRKVRIDLLLEYILLFKISKNLYILYLKTIDIFHIKNYKKD